MIVVSKPSPRIDLIGPAGLWNLGSDLLLNQDQNDPAHILFRTFNAFHQDRDSDRSRSSAMKNRFDIALLTLIGMLGAAQPVTGQAPSPDGVLPAIDAAAPATFETATFALG